MTTPPSITKFPLVACPPAFCTSWAANLADRAACMTSARRVSQVGIFTVIVKLAAIFLLLYKFMSLTLPLADHLFGSR
jgi:hypothetical protein